MPAGPASSILNSFEFAVHAACLCETAGRYEDAVDHLMRRGGPLRPAAALSCGRCRASNSPSKSPRRPWPLRCAPCRWRPAIGRTRCMPASCCCAPGALTRPPTSLPARSSTYPQDEVAFRLLSAAQMLRGRIEDALEAIDRALVDRPGNSGVPSAPSQPAVPARPARRSGRGVRPGGGARSVKPRRQALAAHGLFRQRPLYRGARRRRRTDPRRAGKRRICAGGAAGTEPPVRDLGRRLRRAERARVATAPGTATASRIFREIAHPRARHPRPDHPRDPHPLRRLEARIRLGIARTDLRTS